MKAIKTKTVFVGIMLGAIALLCSAGCTKTVNEEILGDDFEVEVSGNYNSHNYVDLGLPSGILWATCNVGAASPEDYGDHFAWGETTVKTTYGWNDYKYCVGGDYDQLTKYCNRRDLGYNGFTDTLSLLQPEDDAATVNWGDGWCTPTKEQWEELVNNTTSKWVIWKGVNGRLLTGTNGKTIFLPAAGSRAKYDAGEFGIYWSKSLDQVWAGDAHNLYFYSYTIDVLTNYRNDGSTIRPVRL